MVSIEQINKGVAAYLDNELIANLESKSVQKLILGTGIALLLKNSEKAVETFKENPLIKMMELFDEDGNADIDKLAVVLKEKVKDYGLEIKIPDLKNPFSTKPADYTLMTVHPNDIDKLYQYIMQEE